jgi:dipeptidyl aminopeptidase/acylaminoacyl peptidase
MTTQPEKVIHLNRYYHFTELMRDSAVEGQLLRYQSAHDRTMQSVLILQPAGQRSEKLFFFFHGMDGDSGDGVVVRDIVKRLNATVVAMGGRGPSWVSTAFLADAEQVIRNHASGFQGYYLTGVSMGGTQALSLAGLLPEDLRQSVLGVIALIPGADLLALVARSSNDRVRSTLQASVNGDLSALQQRSPTQILNQYKEGLPFVICHNEEDTLLLTDELEIFIAKLRHERHPVTIFSVPGEHNFTYRDFDYVEVMRKLGVDSTEHRMPLLANEP